MDVNENTLAGPNLGEEIPWYAVYTCCHHEVQVEKRLRQRGVEVFLPLYFAPSRRGDRKKILQLPLFPGYLFVHDFLKSPTCFDILNLPGVVRVLDDWHRLKPVPRESIESIRLVLAGDRPFYPHRCLQKGKQVRVLEGPLAGVHGIIVKAKEKKRKVVIEVELFHQAVAVELEDEAVELWS